VLTSRNKKADPFALTFSGIYISYRLSGLWMPLYIPVINRNPVSHIGHLSVVTKAQGYTPSVLQSFRKMYCQHGHLSHLCP